MAKNDTALAEMSPGGVSQEQIDLAYRAILDGEALPASGDPEVMSRAIIERIMRADTFEEAFRPQTLKAWRETYLDRPVLVRSFHLNPSGFEQGSSVYAVVELQPVTDSGELGDLDTVTCGGRNVLAQLVKALEKGWLDRPMVMTAKTTGEGFTALWLEAGDTPY